MHQEQITKNIKDLEYNRILSRENILLVLIGTSLISVIFAPQEIVGITRIWFTGVLIAGLIVSVIYFDKKLNKIKEEISSL